jgi:hypothetical protein
MTSSDTDIAPQFRLVYDGGVALSTDVQAYLARWPIAKGDEQRDNRVPDLFASEGEALCDRAFRWFNRVTLEVLPHTSFHRDYINRLLRRVTATLSSSKYFEEYYSRGFAFMRQQPAPPRVEHNVEVPVTLDDARAEARESMEAVLRVVRTAMPMDSLANAAVQHMTRSYEPGTAFILMWMDKGRPDLVDVHEAVKEVFAEFGILARRADDVEHQDRITDLVLDQIARSEFLFADLSGERPNVYYEIGYAHASGKHPILYRRTGTPLHFDLSVHNVPEYENVTTLRRSLRERLAAITGRTPPKAPIRS